MSSSVIVTIVVVLGIIVAGGFLLYFVGDLLMSISNKAKDDEAIKNAQLKKQKELESRVKALENSQGKENSTTILYNGAVVENYNPDEEKKVEEVNEEQEEEKEEVKEEVKEEKEEVKEEVKEEPVQEQEEEEEEEEDDQDEASEYIRQRRQELMERLARMQQEEEEEKEENNAVDVSQEEEEKEEKEEEEVKEEPEQPVVPDITEAKFENAIAAGEGEQGLAATMTLEEIEAKLADEQAKLKVNEKELRQCKKEFLPLRRVKRTLENDEKKLRRKEALVAKQKVVLYGVNNYADIDEEKAKKLAEDLDLLDGLKLSVQHCEEVMSKNEQRYPLLEQIFNLLSSRNTEIKNNIKKLQEAIEELKSTSDDSATDSTNAE